MTPCPERIEELVEADVPTLRGRGDSELAAHLAHCPRCTDAAQRMLAANASLDSLLSEYPTLDVDAVLQRAAAKTAGRLDRRRPSRWTALAAAASVATLLLVRGLDRPLPGDPPTLPGAPYAEVEVPAGRNVAVLQTEDPDITVLWLF